MQGKIRIKDIAEMSGVSPGTVDRIIHNRGRVSESARQAVEEVLKKVHYKPNIHITGLSLRRKYKVIITTPDVMEGEYWESIHMGIRKAIRCMKISASSVPYIPITSMTSILADGSMTRLQMDTDAVIIGTTFKEETLKLVRKLEEREIPYLFVDSTVEDTAPLAYFTSDHYVCGYLIARLITSITTMDAASGCCRRCASVMECQYQYPPQEGFCRLSE